MAQITFSPATGADYEWGFQLKKAAEKAYVEAVFGWDEQIQRSFHAKDWAEDKLTLIRLRDVKIGTYLFRETDYGYYLGSFFILPDYQGRGVGSHILSLLIETLDQERAESRLGYLQSNPRVSELYKRFGFVIYNEDSSFVYMRRGHNSDRGDNR